METIVGLLFILLPLIFKLIEKKLQQSGTERQRETMQQIKELFEDESEGLPDEFEIEPESEIEPEPEIVQQPEVAPVIVFPEKVEPAVVKPAAIKRKKNSAPILQEEKNDKKKDKIDPKKLVLYSEIMKPKYKE